MSYENPGKQISLKSTAAIKKHLAVKMSGEEVVVTAAIGDRCIGFVQREGIATEVVPVMVDGITMAVASAAITAGVPVNGTADGEVVTATAAYCGIALKAATAKGDIIPVLILPGYIHTAG